MGIHVAIDGFGRIGRMLFQALCERGLLRNVNRAEGADGDR
jgi:glyceraldehyde-3-phosphate dehydrogenase/erythrose-4-phosphate dehydrogenase